MTDVRWKQRLVSFKRALCLLSRFIEKGELSDLERQGLVKAFEYTYELAWNVMKDYYEYQGTTDIQGSRDAIRMSFSRGLIDDGETWMDMIGSRVRTAHTYNEETANEIAKSITDKYYALFVRFDAKMKELD